MLDLPAVAAADDGDRVRGHAPPARGELDHARDNREEGLLRVVSLPQDEASPPRLDNGRGRMPPAHHERLLWIPKLMRVSQLICEPLPPDSGELFMMAAAGEEEAPPPAASTDGRLLREASEREGALARAERRALTGAYDPTGVGSMLRGAPSVSSWPPGARRKARSCACSLAAWVLQCANELSVARSSAPSASMATIIVRFSASNSSTSEGIDSSETVQFERMESYFSGAAALSMDE